MQVHSFPVLGLRNPRSGDGAAHESEEFRRGYHIQPFPETFVDHHGWQAHLLINVGASSNALELYSSRGAVTWFKQAVIPNSAKISQGDGALVGSRLYVVYPTRGRQIELTTLYYKPTVVKMENVRGGLNNERQPSGVRPPFRSRG